MVQWGRPLDGPGWLGMRRAAVAHAGEQLTTWAGTWRPYLPTMLGDPHRIALAPSADGRPRPSRAHRSARPLRRDRPALRPIASGCDVVTVQRLLVHSSAPITPGVYSHPWPRPRTARTPQRATRRPPRWGTRDSLRTETL